MPYITQRLGNNRITPEWALLEDGYAPEEIQEPAPVDTPATDPAPSVVDQVFNDFMGESGGNGTGELISTPAVSDFQPPPPPPPLPAVIQNVLDSIFPTTTTPPSVAPTPADLAGVSSVNPNGAVVIAPSNETNNIFNQVVNYFFGPSTLDTAGSGVPAAGSGTPLDPLTPTSPTVEAGTASAPGGSGANPAALGTVVTPTSKLPGQVIDSDRSKPQGIPSQVAGTIRGLNLPGTQAIKNDWVLIAVAVAVPVALLGLLWLVRKAFK